MNRCQFSLGRVNKMLFRSGVPSVLALESSANKRVIGSCRSSAMTRRMLAFSFFFLAIVGLPTADFSAGQSLTKCPARSQRLNILKGRAQKVPGTVPARSTIEYHVPMKTNIDVNIKLPNSALRFDLYFLRPSRLITNNDDDWSGQFYSGTEYVLVVNNCSGRTSSRFQLEITSK
jgi:hypothetical protein